MIDGPGRGRHGDREHEPAPAERRSAGLVTCATRDLTLPRGIGRLKGRDARPTANARDPTGPPATTARPGRRPAPGAPTHTSPPVYSPRMTGAADDDARDSRLESLLAEAQEAVAYSANALRSVRDRFRDAHAEMLAQWEHLRDEVSTVDHRGSEPARGRRAGTRLRPAATPAGRDPAGTRLGDRGRNRRSGRRPGERAPEQPRRRRE